MRIEALTFFRFLAATIVIIFHFGKSTDIAKSLNPFILSGSQMVTFFFVLSGFVLMISHYHKPTETLQKFYLSRVARIVPLYMIALFIMVYFEFGRENSNTMAMILSISFLQSWFPPYALSYNIPGWSLSVEAFFYLTFPFIIFVIKHSKIQIATLTIFSMLFYIFTQAILSHYMSHKLYDSWPSIFHDTVHYSPLFHYCSFILGVTGGYIYVQKKVYFNKKGFSSFLPMFFTLYLTYYFLQHPDFLTTLLGIPLAYKSSFYSFLFILLILSIAYSNNIITKILSFRLFVILGEISYAMYILQQPIYVTYNKYISDYLQLNTNNDFYTYFVLLLLISILAFYLIEKPANYFIKNKLPLYYRKITNKKILSLH